MKLRFKGHYRTGILLLSICLIALFFDGGFIGAFFGLGCIIATIIISKAQAEMKKDDPRKKGLWEKLW